MFRLEAIRYNKEGPPQSPHLLPKKSRCRSVGAAAPKAVLCSDKCHKLWHLSYSQRHTVLKDFKVALVILQRKAPLACHVILKGV